MSANSWIAEYTAALEARDAREKAHAAYINAYTKLADRTAAIEAAAREASSSTANVPTPPSPAQASHHHLPFRRHSPSPSTPSGPSLDRTSELTRLRSDLSRTQQARAALESQLQPLRQQLQAAESRVESLQSQIASLTRANALLERKVRDRDDELREKSKMVADAQDELVALEMQVNVAERRRGELEAENRELVERWMQAKGREADEWNRRGGF